MRRINDLLNDSDSQLENERLAVIKKDSKGMDRRTKIILGFLSLLIVVGAVLWLSRLRPAKLNDNAKFVATTRVTLGRFSTVCHNQRRVKTISRN